ncbi:Flp family type IVb pilin [Staphylococcus epidermidis]|nr:Flp family type IVb pilin [Staphylococcus epidermidis]HSU24240.1 Flp family type IVb pilin [Variovorax sp.]
MKAAFLKFIRDERGATAIEYGIIAGMMAVVLVAIFGNSGTLTNGLKNTFLFIAAQLPKITP